MEDALHRFVRLLRAQGMRLSAPEVVDAMRAAALPGVMADRDALHDALAVSLVKDRRDQDLFDEVFERFFTLRPVRGDDAHDHDHAHDDLADGGELEQFTLSDDVGDNPSQGHSHGTPRDLHEFFRPEDMAQQYNLHQEANRLDMASLTDEIVLSDAADASMADAARVQLSTSRLHNPGHPGELVTTPGLELDVELTVAEEMALLAWLRDPDAVPDDLGPDGPDLDELRRALAPLLDGLPERLRDHLQRLLATDHDLERREVTARGVEEVGAHERHELEVALRRLLRSLKGAPRPRRRVAARGTIDSRRTMRTNMRYGGVPFRPVTVARVEDRPRLVVLTDVSLSVRATARFTLHLVHSLHNLATRVRTFAFVADVVEISDLFEEHHLEEALSLVFAGLPSGGVLDVDADSDYGAVFDAFMDDHAAALTHRTTVVVLGDGRTNGRDPGLGSFEEIARRSREVVWLTPEPRYSWGLGGCELPRYAEFCDRVEVVRDLSGLDRATGDLAPTGR